MKAWLERVWAAATGAVPRIGTDAEAAAILVLDVLAAGEPDPQRRLVYSVASRMIQGRIEERTK